MRFQAGIQIFLLIVAVVIVFTVIKPKFEEISYLQNEMVTYQNALDNISRYNQRLQALINQANAMSTEERASLHRYLPDEIDALAVGRDIANIAEENNLLLLDIEPSAVVRINTTVAAEAGNGTEMVGVSDPAATDDVFQNGAGTTDESTSGGMFAQRFKISVVGRYEQMKEMLADIERNNYPLRLVDFEFNLNEEGSQLTEYTLTVESYALSGE